MPKPDHSTTRPEHETNGAASCGHDALLEALVWVARARGRQVSRSGLTSGLPLPEGKLVPSLVIRAAERAGLEARLLEVELEALRADALPAILLLDHEQACVLIGCEDDRATIVDTSGERQVVSLASLANRYLGTALLTRLVYDFDRRAPEIGRSAARHWFFRMMAEQLPLYRDVLLGAAMVNLFALGLPLFTMNVYDRVVPNRAIETLWMLAAGLVIVLLAEFTLRSMRAYFLDLASKRVDVQASAFIMERVLGMRLEARPPSVGSLAANLRAFETVRDFATSATVTSLVDLPFALLFVLVIGWIAWPMMIPALVAMLVVIGIAAFTGTRMHVLSESTHRASAMRNASLIESLVGLESVKALGAEGVMQDRWERSAAYLADQGARLRTLAATTVQVAQLAQQLTAIAVIVIGVYMISAVQLSLGGLIACSMLTARALAPMSQLAGLLTQYHNARTALAGLDQIMEHPVERPKGAHFLSRQSFRGDIEFRDVTFAYPGSDLNALREVSLHIRAGEKVAILGRTGSGKSTLLRLMMGLYQPLSGAVLVDGIDLRQLDPGELRRSIGYVPQDITLFFGTLRDNLTMGTSHVEDTDIVEAMDIGHLTEFVNRHPQGIEMPVGERGESLSGGQRAGVAIARAVIGKPAILLLDEPTGAMDHSTEEAVKASLRSFSANRTVVIVAHRSSLLDMVDRIIVTDNGRIVADGPKDTVMEALRQGRVGRGA